MQIGAYAKVGDPGSGSGAGKRVLSEELVGEGVQQERVAFMACCLHACGLMWGWAVFLAFLLKLPAFVGRGCES